MNQRSVISSFLAVLCISWGLAAETRGQETRGQEPLGQGLLDLDWSSSAQATAANWEITSQRGEQFLANTADKSNSFEASLNGIEDHPVTAVLSYGWRHGRGAAQAELELLSDGASLVLLARQRDGQDKYVLYAVDGDERRELGTLPGETADNGANQGGVSNSATVALTVSPGKATIRRLGGPSATFETGQNTRPTVIKVRDTSPAKEQLRLSRLRAFAGELDPVLTPVAGGLSMPIGGMTVQGAAPDLKLALVWADDKPRDATFSLTLASLDAQSHELGQQQVTLTNGEPLRLRTTDIAQLTPGFYEVSGQLSVGTSDQVMVKARLAIVDPELAGRSRQEIPQWVGLVPYINVLDREQFAQSFDFMALMGVRHVRWLPGWGRLEPERDQYDWSETDRFMQLCEQHDIEAMFCLSYFGAPWTGQEVNAFNEKAGIIGEPMAFGEFGRKLWVDHFAVPVIQRYGDRVKDYQIWNEPDAFWNDDPAKATGFAKGFGTPANYYDLFRRTHEAAHALEHDGIRVLMSLSSAHQSESLARMFSMGLADNFDGLIIHTYGNHLGHFQRARQILAKYGFADAAIGSGEIGIPTSDTLEAEVRQSEKIARVMLQSACVESPLIGIDWFVLHDRVAGGQFGLLDRNLQPQPGVLAYFTVARTLVNAQRGTVTRKGDIEMFRIPRDGRPPLVALFSGGSTSRLNLRVDGDAIAWNLQGQSVPLNTRDGFAEASLINGPLLIEGDVTPVMDAFLTITPVLADAQPGLRVTVEAERESSVKAQLHVQSAEMGLDETRSVTLKPGKNEFQIELKPQAVQPSVLYQVSATVNYPQGFAESSRAMEFTAVHRVSAEQADALRPPEDLPVVTLDQAAQFTPFGGNSWGGPEDISAQITFGYTDKLLVVWVEQQDDQHMFVRPPNPWGYDGLQLAIDPTGDRKGSSPSVEVIFGIAENNEMFASVMDQPHYKPQLVAKREGTTTLYRLQLPLSQFQLSAEAGQRIGLSLIMNDNDGNGRRGWLHFGSGIAEEKNPARYRELIFAP